jgi:hypothetical protein
MDYDIIVINFNDYQGQPSSSIKLVDNPVYHARSKHIKI